MAFVDGVDGGTLSCGCLPSATSLDYCCIGGSWHVDKSQFSECSSWFRDRLAISLSFLSICLPQMCIFCAGLDPCILDVWLYHLFVHMEVIQCDLRMAVA